MAPNLLTYYIITLSRANFQDFLNAMWKTRFSTRKSDSRLHCPAICSQTVRFYFEPDPSFTARLRLKLLWFDHSLEKRRNASQHSLLHRESLSSLHLRIQFVSVDSWFRVGGNVLPSISSVDEWYVILRTCIPRETILPHPAPDKIILPMWNNKW